MSKSPEETGGRRGRRRRDRRDDLTWFGLDVNRDVHRAAPGGGRELRRARPAVGAAASTRCRRCSPARRWSSPARWRATAARRRRTRSRPWRQEPGQRQRQDLRRRGRRRTRREQGHQGRDARHPDARRAGSSSTSSPPANCPESIGSEILVCVAISVDRSTEIATQTGGSPQMPDRSDDVERPAVAAGGVGALGGLEEDDLGLVEPLGERLDRRALGGLERQDGVAGSNTAVGGRSICWPGSTSMSSSGVTGISVPSMTTAPRSRTGSRRRSPPAGGPGRRSPPVTTISMASGRSTPSSPVRAVTIPQMMSTAPQAMTKLAISSPGSNRRRGAGSRRGLFVDERHDAMMPAHNPTHPPDSVSRSW